MSVTDTTPRGESESIFFEFDLTHSPEKVWRALTDPALLTRWLLPVTGLRLEPGVEFSFRTDPLPGWDGVVACRVLEIDPGRRLSYAWEVGDMELQTVVTFTLSPTETGTLLTLVQSGFKPSQRQAAGGARYGWKMMGGRLVELLDATP